jgi:uncharacterized protein (TIGR02996 family)
VIAAWERPDRRHRLAGLLPTVLRAHRGVSSTSMTALSELWRQVAEAPEDLAPRLVLADALIEAGDPRGELIVLQCGGADASVMVTRDDGEGPDNVAERVNDLVAGHWDRWLGDVAAVIHRQGSLFRDGMLSSIYVGSEDPVPEALWDSLGHHHELCAVRQIRPRKVTADRYGRFLASLTRVPPWVELRSGTLRSLHARRSRWPIRGARLAEVGMWQLSSPDADLVQLSLVSPELEHLELSANWIPRELAPNLVSTIEQLPRMFRALRSIKLDNSARSLQDIDDEQLARLHAMPMLELA